MAESRVVTIFGSSAIRPGDADFEMAERLGRALARAGYTICNGGYTGSMEATARGACQGGGEVIGVTTDAFADRRPNPYLTVERKQRTLLARIETLVRTGEAYVILPGGIGTIAELMIVWNLLAIGSIPPRPVLLLGDNYAELLKALEGLAEIGPEQLRFLKVVSSIEEVLTELRRHFEHRDGDGGSKRCETPAGPRPQSSSFSLSESFAD